MLSAVFVLLSCLAGCVQRLPSNSACEWPQQIGSQRDLRQDAEFAEDLAIRYADATRGTHSGHFEGVPEYDRTRDACMAKLFQTVATSHGTLVGQVRAASLGRRLDWDFGILFSFAALYAFGANRAGRWIWSRKRDREDFAAGLVMCTYIGLLFAGVGVMLGESWAGLMEIARLGNGHLSYRAERIPWARHRPEIFAAGLVLFGLVSLWQYKSAARTTRMTNPASA